MKRLLPFLVLLPLVSLLAACSNSHRQEPATAAKAPALAAAEPELVEVAAIKGAQLTGITVSDSGRIFVNFPRWRDNIPFSVAEVMPDGSFKPFPDARWNSWQPGEPAAERFVCVQSVVIDDQGFLWALDPASPGIAGVIEEGAKLVRFDIDTGEAVQTIRFDRYIAPEKSYLNDLRIDTAAKEIYITDSGLGAIVVVNYRTGKARRLLADHPATRAEDAVLAIDGKRLLFTDGGRPQIHSDGIALDRRNGYLFFHALTGYTLYRVKTADLLDETLPPEELGRRVEGLGPTPAPDGMILDDSGNLFMADLEHNAVVYRTPAGDIGELAADDRLQWVDTFSFDRQGDLYFTCSHIHQTEWFVKGAAVAEMRFEIYRLDR